ncbi:MAG: hypothetical protein AB2669_00505, partial [Candidatus Thiodiazotropha endolucinida]
LQRFVVSSISTRSKQFEYYRKCWDLIRVSLYIRNDWQMPKGFIDSEQKSPFNYTREEWQQAKRNKQDPKALKAMFQECWAISDSQQAFSQALQERGYYLAMGDRRGFVALDYQGKPYSLSRWIGIKPEALGEKINRPEDLLSLKAQKTEIANKLTVQIREYIQQAKIEFEKHKAVIALQKSELVQKQRSQRKKLQTAQQKRQTREIRHRSARLPKGFSGIWSRLTGKYYRIRRQNEYETCLANIRDRAERQSPIEKHLKERRQLQTKIKSSKREQIDLINGLHSDIARSMEMTPENSSAQGQEFNNVSKGTKKTNRKRARTNPSPGFEP